MEKIIIYSQCDLDRILDNENKSSLNIHYRIQKLNHQHQNRCLLDFDKFINLTYIKIKLTPINNVIYLGDELIIVHNILSIKSNYIKHIDCLSNGIDKIVELPKNIKVLKCTDNQLKQLDILINYNDLVQLECCKNNISSISTVLNLTNLKILKCSNNPLNYHNRNIMYLSDNLIHLEISSCELNNITQIKNQSNLEILKINSNAIKNIDLIDFKKLINFECSSNNISQITNIPDCLQILKCNCNNLTELKCLSTDLKILNCSFNKIKELDNLPTELEILICNSNLLTKLDYLPNYIKKLDASNNLLTNLDNLPNSLTNLILSNNPIKNLDNLPHRLEKLKLNGNSQIESINNVPKNIKQIIVMSSDNYNKDLFINLDYMQKVEIISNKFIKNIFL